MYSSVIYNTIYCKQVLNNQQYVESIHYFIIKGLQVFESFTSFPSLSQKTSHLCWIYIKYSASMHSSTNGNTNNQIIAQMRCVMSIKTLIEETGFRQSLLERIEYWPKFHFRIDASPDCVTFEMWIQLNRILNRPFIS